MSEHAALLAVALLIDAALGEPRAIWSRIPHPAILMGRCVDWLDRTLNQGTSRKFKGTVAVAIMAVGAVAIGVALSLLPYGAVLELIVAAFLLAQRSLVEHVGAVAAALRRSTEEGRQAVSMIVGRNTGNMDEAAIARAAIESAAENVSDGVVAPAFWSLVGGAPGVILYKMINTADSMIGHRTERHADFGWAAARLDDVLNWVPARLTAAFIALSSGKSQALSGAVREGPQHRSVNAGWPEAAMAHVLGIALSGPRRYGDVLTDDPVLNPHGRQDAKADDIKASVRVLWRVWATVMVFTVAIAVL